MAYELIDVHAVITGASDGLGLAMARALLQNGATVALAARPSEKLNKAVSDLRDRGLKAFSLPMDVRSERSIDDAVKWVEEHWGRIDLLVNNAGLMMQKVNPRFITNPQPFFKVDPDGFRDMVDTNFTGYFLVARGFTPMMVEQKKGHIVNISTSYTTMTKKGFVPYGPSRAGSEALSNVMSADLNEYGITVNVLLPGGPVDKGGLSEETQEISQLPIALLSPDIMNEPILFLASPLAEGITGERIIACEFQEWLQTKGIQTSINFS
jgi:gluconate 5-dehydrogenase